MKSGVRAIDFMTTNVLTTTKDKTIDDIAKVLNKYRIGGLPVVNSRGNILGIITERDIMRRVISPDKKPSKIRKKYGNNRYKNFRRITDRRTLN